MISDGELVRRIARVVYGSEMQAGWYLSPGDLDRIVEILGERYGECALCKHMLPRDRLRKRDDMYLCPICRAEDNGQTRLL